MDKIRLHKQDVLVTGRVSAEMYAKYQKQVSEILPIEEIRPSVILKLGPEESEFPIVLIGGMGPLSDASILLKLLKHVPSKTSVTLYSFPPPRKDPVAFLSHLLCLKQYMSTHTRGKCFLLSNTAHVMFQLFDQVVLKKSPLLLVNLVDIAARHVSESTSTHDTLVLLTTLVSWRTELYESRITGFKDVIRCNSRDAKEIQRAVDLAKQGDTSGKKLLLRYLDKVMNKLDGRRVVVFLGCTDFVFLGKNLVKDIGKKYKVTVMDTDSMFAEDIAHVYDTTIEIKEENSVRYGPEKIFNGIYEYLERDNSWTNLIAISMLALTTLTLSLMSR